MTGRMYCRAPALTIFTQESGFDELSPGHVGRARCTRSDHRRVLISTVQPPPQRVLADPQHTEPAFGMVNSSRSSTAIPTDLLQVRFTIYPDDEYSCRMSADGAAGREMDRVATPPRVAAGSTASTGSYRTESIRTERAEPAPVSAAIRGSRRWWHCGSTGRRFGRSGA